MLSSNVAHIYEGHPGFRPDFDVPIFSEDPGVIEVSYQLNRIVDAANRGRFDRIAGYPFRIPVDVES